MPVRDDVLGERVAVWSCPRGRPGRPSCSGTWGRPGWPRPSGRSRVPGGHAAADRVGKLSRAGARGSPKACVRYAPDGRPRRGPGRHGRHRVPARRPRPGRPRRPRRVGGGPRHAGRRLRHPRGPAVRAVLGAGPRPPGRADFAAFVHERTPAGPDFRGFRAPNADTLYSNAWLDLRGGPTDTGCRSSPVATSRCRSSTPTATPPTSAGGPAGTPRALGSSPPAGGKRHLRG